MSQSANILFKSVSWLLKCLNFILATKQRLNGKITVRIPPSLCNPLGLPINKLKFNTKSLKLWSNLQFYSSLTILESRSFSNQIEPRKVRIPKPVAKTTNREFVTFAENKRANTVIMAGKFARAVAHFFADQFRASKFELKTGLWHVNQSKKECRRCLLEKIFPCTVMENTFRRVIYALKCLIPNRELQLS